MGGKERTIRRRSQVRRPRQRRHSSLPEGATSHGAELQQTVGSSSLRPQPNICRKIFSRSFFRNTQKTFENTKKKKFGFLMVIKTLTTRGKNLIPHLYLELVLTDS